MGSVDQIKMKDLQTEAEKKPFAAAVKALWIEMFEDKESYVDHYMSSSWKHNRVLLLLRGEEIVSMLHLNPYTCIVQGERLDLHYIVGVCTKKAEQGKGYMGYMLNVIVSKSFWKILFNPHVRSAWTVRCLNAFHSPPSCKPH